jgi:hypothetical protein
MFHMAVEAGCGVSSSFAQSPSMDAPVVLFKFPCMAAAAEGRYLRTGGPGAGVQRVVYIVGPVAGLAGGNTRSALSQGPAVNAELELTHLRRGPVAGEVADGAVDRRGSAVGIAGDVEMTGGAAELPVDRPFVLCLVDKTACSLPVMTGGAVGLRPRF